MDLKLSSPGILRSAAPCDVSYATTNQIYWSSDTDDMVFVGTLIWYHTKTKTHKTNTLTHKYKHILTPPFTCTQQLPVLHWMNNLLIQNFTL